MKYAVIAEYTTLMALGLYNRGYQFALGQRLIEDRGESFLRLSKYGTFYRCASFNGCFTIVDNGAAEKGEYGNPEGVDFSDIVEAANLIKADEIIMPDVLFDAEKTLRATLDWKAMKLVPPRQRMIVAQGNTWEEWKYCLRELTVALGHDFASIGIPKHLERLEGGRVRAVRHLVSMGLHMRHNIHLLGVWRDPVEEITSASQACPLIRGVDTGRPVACAQAAEPLHVKVSLKWEPLDSSRYRVAEGLIQSMDIICR